jgi:RNA polymerase sigma factor (sigma-70 family)
MTKRATAISADMIRVVAGACGAGASDRDLLRRFAETGDQDAFAALFRRHAGMVLGVCRRGLPTLQDAEDACQATFLVLSRKAKSGRWQPSVANWLYLTARRVSRNARVIAERRVRREGRAAGRTAVQPVDRMSGRDLLDTLDIELGNLPSAYREPLVLCYLEGLTRDEAAMRLGVPSGTLKTRLERGRKLLSDALTRRGCVAGAGLLALAATSTARATPLRLADPVPAAVARLAGGVAVKSIVSKSAAALLLLAGTAALGFGLVSAKPPVTQEPSADDKVPAAEAKPAVKPAPDLRNSRQISGRVLAPDGKPVAGAKLFMPELKTANRVSIEDIQVREIGTSAADGRFNVAVSPVYKDLPWCYAIAYAPGFGVDWVQLNINAPAPAGEQILRLTEDLAIVSRVVSTEGKPLPGLSITAANIDMPPGDRLDDYLATLKKNMRAVGRSSPRKSLPAALNHIVGPALTDQDGRFTVHGVGAERIVQLQIAGGGMARSTVFVVTRRGFDPKPYNDLLLNKEYDDLRVLNRFHGLYGPEFTFVIEAGREISGAVTDSVTGKPVPGCSVFAGTGYDSVGALTDAQGRYRLEGLPKAVSQSSVTVRPPEGTDYLSRNVRMNETDGFAPGRLDIQMAKASVVKGRVIDKQTGKGVRAYIRVAPLPNNKVFGTRPEFSLYAGDRTTKETDVDGRFRLPTIPGPAVILAQVGAPEMLYGERFCRYRRAVPDPDHKDQFRRFEGSWTIVTVGNSNEFLFTENADKVIDVKDSGETEVNLFVDRGVSAKIAVQDADGQPLSGARVAGLTDLFFVTYRLPESTATVYALDPANPRTLALYHADKRLGGQVTVRGDEKEPVVVRLSPLGRLTGRLLDGDGQPLAGMTVSVSPTRTIDRALYEGDNGVGTPARTDKDGRFALEGVLPEMPFYAGFRKGNDYYVGKPKVGSHKLKPGETLDLGDRTLQPSR